MIDFYVYWLQWALLGWLGTLIVLVLISFLRGTVQARGMLKSVSGGGYDPERLVLLFATVGVALYYSINTLGVDLEELKKTSEAGTAYYMPDISEEVLFLLFGAQSTYVTGKLFRNTKGAG